MLISSGYKAFWLLSYNCFSIYHKWAAVICIRFSCWTSLRDWALWFLRLRCSVSCDTSLKWKKPDRVWGSATGLQQGRQHGQFFRMEVPSVGLLPRSVPENRLADLSLLPIARCRTSAEFGQKKSTSRRDAFLYGMILFRLDCSVWSSYPHQSGLAPHTYK